MDIFDLLTMIGGLCLFLFGMSVMGDALERRAGNSLRTILSKLTGNWALGLLTGMVVTAVIQSSSATTVMVVGFVNSGLLSLKQAISVIMGANVGTTITAWILSLSGIDGDSIFMQLLKPTSFTPVLALIGIFFYMSGKKDTRKDTGLILLGFATLMFGMDTMSGAVKGLANVPAFQQLFIVFKNPILGALAGAVLTGIIQSSSASVGILQALAQTGQVSYGAAIPIIMGQNIGTTVTALLSSVGTNKNARRTALVHLCFNLIGTVIWLSVFSLVEALLAPAILDQGASQWGIAVCHSAFNILCTIVLLPCSGLLEKLALRLIPEDKQAERLVELDERLLVTPPVALQQCRKVTAGMAQCSSDALQDAMTALNGYNPTLDASVREKEALADHYEDILSSYMVKLSSQGISQADSNESAMLLKVIGDFERISDHSVNLIESAQELYDKKISFSESAQRELAVLTAAVQEIMSLSLRAFLDNDLALAIRVEPLEQVIDDLKEQMRTRHILRLQQGSCNIEAGFIWSDLLTNLERIGDHCSNVAGCIVDMSHHDMNIHENLRSARSDSAYFDTQYRLYSQKYQLNH